MSQLGEYILYFLWGVLIVGGILVGGYLIGGSVHANDELQHKFQLDCIQSGGHMEIVGNSNSTIVCQKR